MPNPAAGDHGLPLGHFQILDGEVEIHPLLGQGRGGGIELVAQIGQLGDGADGKRDVEFAQAEFLQSLASLS